ncbi:MAG TPA: cyclic nucleotide-binding domain-containing protein [Actinomycetota bacterium]|nr:cyclic nucleotide-binding domain-containing protein [Actinomycetota bacterium]
MGTADAVDMLARVPIFSSLSRRELQAIARQGKEVRHGEGAVLAREGDAGLGFFLILEGEARVTVKGRFRRTLGPGDFFGEISLLDGGPRTATVTAATPVRLLGIAQWAFKRLVDQHPSMASKMLRAMASRLRASAPKEQI